MSRLVARLTNQAAPCTDEPSGPLHPEVDPVSTRPAQSDPGRSRDTWIKVGVNQQTHTAETELSSRVGPLSDLSPTVESAPVRVAGRGASHARTEQNFSTRRFQHSKPPDCAVPRPSTLIAIVTANFIWSWRSTNGGLMVEGAPQDGFNNFADGQDRRSQAQIAQTSRMQSPLH